MKNLTLAIAGFLTIGFMASCEKTYTCTCTYPNSSVGTTKTEFKAKKRGDAETSCASLNVNAKLQGGACAL